MALSNEEKQIVEFGKANGKTPLEVKTAIAKYRSQSTTTTSDMNTTTPSPTREAIQDAPSDIKETISGIGQTLKTGYDTVLNARAKVASGEITPGAGAIEAGGATAKALITSPFQAIIGALKLPFSPTSEKKIADKVKEFAGGFMNKASDYNKRFEEKAISEGGTNAKTVEQIRGLAEKYKTDPSFKSYVDGASDFAEAGAEVLGFKGSGKVLEEGVSLGNKARKLSSELDIPYFRETEDAVAGAIATTKKLKESGQTPQITPTSIQALQPDKRSILDKGIDTALMVGQKTVQTYRDLVDASQTRIVRNLDNQAIRENSALKLPEVEQNIAKMYTNAVSPGVKGKKVSTEGIVANQKQAVGAIKDITVNKSNVSFRDIETNQIVKGELPSNLWEFGGAVTSRKSQVYQDILKQIGKAADTPVDTSRIADAMYEIIENPVYAGESAILNRARQALDKYSLTDYTPAQLEELIKLENDKLQAFYRGQGTQGDAVVSALVANNLRDLLDEAVEAATGTTIRPLKSEYGNLAAIERDVVHRALHNAQARDAGLVDMFGIRTIGDLSAGLSGDIGALKRGASQIVGEGFIKALNDRDAMINRMFMVADQTYTK